MRGITITKIVAVVFGSILVILGALALTLFPRFINEEVAKKSYIGFDSNGTYNELTQKWIEPPYQMSLQIWIYSVINEAEVMKGSYPKFAEKGPYTFSLHQRKSKLRFMHNDSQVLYRTEQVYHFNSTLSCNNCSLSDKVTFPNPVFQVIIDLANMSGQIGSFMIEKALKSFGRETPFITTTIQEMTFDGFEDPVISTICNIEIIKVFCNLLNVPKKIGFFYGQNGTDDGEYLVDTGLINVKNLGKVYEYNSEFKLPDSYWYSPQARMINGTNLIFPPDISKSDRLYLFLGQLKRSIYLRYNKKFEVEGVPAWEFIFPPELYDPTRPENKGFCNPKTPRFFDNETQPNGCLPKGFLDLGSTQPGNMRIYLSGSHYYYSPSSVYKNFDGFQKPSTENDEPQYDIEPTTGVIVRVNQRSQINIGMLKSNFSALTNVPEMIAPVLWFNETVIFDDGTRDELLVSLISVQNKVFIVGIIVTTIGVFLLVAFVVLMVVSDCVKKPSEEEEHLITNEQHEEDLYNNFPQVDPLPNVQPLLPEQAVYEGLPQQIIEPPSH